MWPFNFTKHMCGWNEQMHGKPFCTLQNTRCIEQDRWGGHWDDVENEREDDFTPLRSE